MEQVDHMSEDLTVPSQYLDYVFEVMRRNEGFLRQNANEAYDELLELMNDAIDYLGFFGTGSEIVEEIVGRSVGFFVYHALMPLSTGMHLNLLAGNIPGCFIQLRSMLETLVKCYVADSLSPELPFFQERLDSLERSLRQEKTSVSKLMKELGQKLEVGDEFVALWGKLSEDWVHTRGYADRLVHEVVENSNVPPWALTIPMYYVEGDSNSLDELRHRISQFRALLTITMATIYLPQ